MPINFLNNTGKTSSSKLTFGLCDDPPPSTKPAYIDEANNVKWIATVNNPRQIRADFHAVDHCVVVLRVDGKLESRCDGILLHESNITFVELKDRRSRGWLGDGIGQLTITHGIFKANHDITAYTQVEAYVANKQRPNFHASFKTEVQKFKTTTGITLRVQSTINI